MKILFLACLVGVVAMAPAAAQTHDHGHAAHAPAATSPSNEEFAAANATMHRDMAIPLTGDADRDFVESMIPHHQGAVDMARILLRHGRDPALKKIAEEIIAAQEREIAMFRDWLAARK